MNPKIYRDQNDLNLLEFGESWKSFAKEVLALSSRTPDRVLEMISILSADLAVITANIKPILTRSKDGILKNIPKRKVTNIKTSNSVDRHNFQRVNPGAGGVTTESSSGDPGPEPEGNYGYEDSDIITISDWDNKRKPPAGLGANTGR